MNPGRAVDAGEILIDQHPQDLGLGVARHVGDFVDIERAAMRLFERPGFPRAAVARFHAEQLHFHGFRGDRGGVDDHEGPAGAVRRLMDGARRQLLADARARR